MFNNNNNDMKALNYQEIYKQIQEAPITSAKKQKAFNLLSKVSYPLQNGFLVSEGFAILEMTLTTTMSIAFYSSTNGVADKFRDTNEYGEVNYKYNVHSTFEIESKTKKQTK